MTNSKAESGAYADVPEMDHTEVERLKRKFGFSEEQIRQFQEAFSVFDRDADGIITLDELGTVMFSLGLRPSKQELEALIKGVDKTDSGNVDFDEFIELMSIKVNVDGDAELREVFSVINAGGDGFITSAELYDVLLRLGEPTSSNEVEEMIREADSDGDGKISITEFKRILMAK